MNQNEKIHLMRREEKQIMKWLVYCYPLFKREYEKKG